MGSDGHKIFEKGDVEQKPLNPPEDIVIGNHVWLGRGATVLKGAKISDNSVVGINSVVNKKFREENIVIAGAPAKKLRKTLTGHTSFKLIHTERG